MNDTSLLDYPFDLYQRTRDIKEIVDIITRETSMDRLKMLDVARIECGLNCLAVGFMDAASFLPT